ncbi:TatD family hydrolase [Patescibacteria group bacterium]|nr:TatD family hydrolase [Patescibacteria group bacterium]
MQPKLFDIHCHLDFSEFDKDREEVIKRALSNGIGMVNVGTDYESSKKAIELAEKYEHVYATVGLHPHSIHLGVKPPSECPSIPKLKALAKHPKVVGIGECGLDYKFQDTRNNNQTNINLQKSIFKQQIELALEVNKPLMIHCRDAHEDLLAILSTYYSLHSTRLQGNLHFFSGTWEEAQKYFDLGFSISFAGPVTYDVGRITDIVSRAPINKIMIETDSPFAAPAPFRGQRNEPFYVQEIAKKIAQIKNLTYEEICKITTKNALKIFINNVNI